jgi:hypothetical protein
MEEGLDLRFLWVHPRISAGDDSSADYADERRWKTVLSPVLCVHLRIDLRAFSPGPCTFCCSRAGRHSVNN